MTIINISQIEQASQLLKEVIKETPLEFCSRLSKKYGAEIYLKREDLQEVRSFKIRGAYNKMRNFSIKERKKGAATASAGNHAQGVAFSCAKLKIKGVIFMPKITPLQKVERVRYFGEKFVEIKLVGNNFDETAKIAKKYSRKRGLCFISPFDDPLIIAGQGTIGKEIYETLSGELDFVLVPIGGGGLISGIATYLKEMNPKKIKIIGVEPEGADSMYESLKKGKIVNLKNINNFAEGVAVKKPGKLTFKICQKYVDEILKVPEGKLAQTIIELYQNEGIIAEPAGVLAVSVLDYIREIKGKRVVSIISGGNNDLLRYPEILEKSLIYQGRKHYLLVEFAQKPGQLKKFVNKVLGPEDDIVLFEYIKKNNREKGPVLIGIELRKREDLKPLLRKMKIFGFEYKVLNQEEITYRYLI